MAIQSLICPLLLIFVNTALLLSVRYLEQVNAQASGARSLYVAYFQDDITHPRRYHRAKYDRDNSVL